jgi:hypothetical protein
MVRVHPTASSIRLASSTKGIDMAANGDAQVMAANGGQPTSSTGKLKPRANDNCRTAGLILATKKSNAMKTPANPAASATVLNNARCKGTRAASAIKKNDDRQHHVGFKAEKNRLQMLKGVHGVRKAREQW